MATAITVSKSMTPVSGDLSIGTYRISGGVAVQQYQGDIVTNQAELSYTGYAQFRNDVLERFGVTLPNYQPPEIAERTNPNGNVLGRAVGEAAASKGSAQRANPEVNAEAAAEGVTGDKILDGLQTGLDVVGLIPGFGEIADLANAGISLARGDYAGAALSLLSAIPFAGWLGTAGKVGRRGAKAAADASAKATKEAAERAAKKEAADKAAKEAAQKRAKEAAEKKASGGKVKQPRVVKKNGYTYHLDDKGRVTKVEGDLKLNKGQGRNPTAQKQAGGPDRLPDDQGGHYIGRRFDGPKDDFNHFAQNGNFNNSAYRKLENSWEKAIKDGKSVRVEVSPSFKGDSLRPDTLKVRQWIDGKPQPLRIFRNAPGG